MPPFYMPRGHDYSYHYVLSGGGGGGVKRKSVKESDVALRRQIKADSRVILMGAKASATPYHHTCLFLKTQRLYFCNLFIFLT